MKVSDETGNTKFMPVDPYDALKRTEAGIALGIDFYSVL